MKLLPILILLAPSAFGQTLSYVYHQEHTGTEYDGSFLRLPASLEGAVSGDAVFVSEAQGAVTFRITNTATFPISGSNLDFVAFSEAWGGEDGTGFGCWGTDLTSHRDSVDVPEIPANGEVILTGTWHPWAYGTYLPLDFSWCYSSGVIGNGPILAQASTEVYSFHFYPPQGFDQYLTCEQIDEGGTGFFSLTFPLELPQLSADTSCTSEPNSSGKVCQIEAYGSAAIADDFLVLRVTGAPSGKSGYFMLSQVAAHLPGFRGGQGTLCLGAPIVRLTGDVHIATPSNMVTFKPTLGDIPGAGINAGETWQFQYWYRDENPGQTHNTSNGLALTFQ